MLMFTLCVRKFEDELWNSDMAVPGNRCQNFKDNSYIYFQIVNKDTFNLFA